jgi:hypothetical protein
VPARAAKLKYRLTKNHNRVVSELVDFDKADSELVAAHTEKDADGNTTHPALEDGTPDLTRVTLSDPAAFIAARNELLSSTVSVDLMTLPLSWFDGIDAPTDDLYRYCDFLIEDDSE